MNMINTKRPRKANGGTRARLQEQGVALVMVLLLLALATLIAVTFLTSVTVEKKSADADFALNRARNLVDTAIALGVSQLVEATTREDGGGNPLPWISQPGAIQVFHPDGRLNRLFKLYSAESMVTGDLGTDQDLPEDWLSRTAEFTDLNEPRRSEQDEWTFPILDPRLWSPDPREAVEGFSYDGFPGVVHPNGADDPGRLPMPVRWLYFLRDGTIGVVNRDGAFHGFNGEQASEENPIEYRIAFWIDDESCKINVNTAAEGAYWDTPRADTLQERWLANTIPNRLEYMRHAGHPSTVCLSSVLLPQRRLQPLGFPELSAPEQRMETSDALDLWRLGRLTAGSIPNLTAFGGREAASWSEWAAVNLEARQDFAKYVGPEELFRLANTPDGRGRELKMFERHPGAALRLKRGGGVLTAHSAAPELNLFGQPRVSVWPVHAQAFANLGGAFTEFGRDTPYARKMAMAAKIHQLAYFVQRSEPGNGGMDFQGHAQGANRRLFEYLQQLTSRPIPGFDRPTEGVSSFLTKYGEDRDSILMQIMDYIRSSLFADHQLDARTQFSVLCPGVEHKGFGQVSPLQVRLSTSRAGVSSPVQGMGRVMTLSGIALMITCRAEVDADGVVRGEPSPSNAPLLTNPGDRELDIGFMLEGFVPGQGWTDYRPYVNAILVGGAPDAAPNISHPYPELRLNGVPLQPDPLRRETWSEDDPPVLWRGDGGAVGVRSFTAGALMFRPIVVRAQDHPEGLLDLQSAGDPNLQLKIAVYDAPLSTTVGDLLLVAPLQFPDIPVERGLALPRLPQAEGVPGPLEARLRAASRDNRQTLSGDDIIQALIPIHGDHRLTASQRWAVSESDTQSNPLFVPHPEWGRRKHAHHFHDPVVFPPQSGSSPGYVAGLTYPNHVRPSMPPVLAAGNPHISVWQAGDWRQYELAAALDSLRLDGGKRGAALPGMTGDFDNGVAGVSDGPYMNRPDDGHWAAAFAGMLPYFNPVSQTGAEVPPVALSAFAPHRIFPSAVMFGSLPTGVRAQVPWQTLLFRPHNGHYGTQWPPDYLLLDLFWTPVLEPEPLSVNFETAGKANLNHQLHPFSYIQRRTALHAALKAEGLMAIPDTDALVYKSTEAADRQYRSMIDVSATLNLWDNERATMGRPFLTEAEICGSHLVPEGLVEQGSAASREQMEAFWGRHRLTGDNSRERPYAHLVPKLTVRSNVFRMHFKVQKLAKTRTSPVNEFRPGKDRELATVQGTALLRRSLDTNHPELSRAQDRGGALALGSLHPFYRWKVEEFRQQ